MWEKLLNQKKKVENKWINNKIIITIITIIIIIITMIIKMK